MRVGIVRGLESFVGRVVLVALLVLGAAPVAAQERSAAVIQQVVTVDATANNLAAAGCGGAGGQELFTTLTASTAPPDSLSREQRPLLFRYCDAIAQGGANGWTGEVDLAPDGQFQQSLQLVPDEIFAGVDQSAAVFDVQIGNVTQRLGVLRTAHRAREGGVVLARQDGRVGSPGAAAPSLAAQKLHFDSLFAMAAAEGVHAQVGGSGNGDGPLGFFVNGRLHVVDIDSNNAEGGSDSFGGGVTLGSDLRLGRLGHAGLSFGYTRLDTDYDRTSSAADLDSYAFSAYGALYPTDFLYVDGIVTGSLLRFDVRNDVLILDGAPESGRLSGDADGWTIGGSLGAGLELPMGALLLRPFLRGDYLRTHFDSFTQSGGDGTLDLRIGSQESTSITSNLGLDVGYAISTSIAIVTPHVRAVWVHEYDEQADALTGNLVALPDARFRLRPTSVDRDYATLGGGVAATFAGGFSQFIDYDAMIGFSNVVTHQVTVGLRWAF